MTLEQMKKLFLEKVSESDIKYSWDGGWCYSYIDHPLMKMAEQGLRGEEEDEWQLFTDEWLSEHEGELFHLSDVADGMLMNQAETLHGEEAKRYARGLVDYLEKYGGDYYKQTQIPPLKKFLEEN